MYAPSRVDKNAPFSFGREKSLKTFALGLVTLGTFVVGGCEAITVDEAITVEKSSNGPYYALPSWDQQIPSAQRFTVLSNWGNAAVLDAETGLVWEKEPSSSFLTWYDAIGVRPTTSYITYDGNLGACRNKNIGNRLGWRLPSVEELSSLIDPTQNPALPIGNPFQGITRPSANFWTATTSEIYDRLAYNVKFYKDPIFPFVFPITKSDTELIRAWCVRGGSNDLNAPPPLSLP
jgi:hypothetical protein